MYSNDHNLKYYNQLKWKRKNQNCLNQSKCFISARMTKPESHLESQSQKKQTSILMHMRYRSGLSDHDWVKAENHKLIPSVHAAMIIKEGGWGDPAADTYSGPTLIRIRSGKNEF